MRWTHMNIIFEALQSGQRELKPLQCAKMVIDENRHPTSDLVKDDTTVNILKGSNTIAR